MKYVPPLGSADPNASYQDGNPEAGILGSIVPAAAIERPQREILNVLTAAGLTPSDTDLTQLLAAIRKIIGIQNAELERLRLSMIGVPRYWRSTTLPENHVWANGDLALFSDWPELKKVYDGGGFNGMLLAYNANAATIAANLGRWRPNAANPTGLFVPNLSDQFFRAWTGAGNAGGYNAPGVPDVIGSYGQDGNGSNENAITWGPQGAFSRGALTVSGEIAGNTNYMTFAASRSNKIYGASSTVMPSSVNIPACIYLGLSA